MTDEVALYQDVAAVTAIEAIPTMLEVICRTTGMGFAAVARVTEDRWIACQVLDNINFGLKSGGELKIKTTICDEIRGHKTAVLIDHVEKDDLFRDHPTPRKYGFQSYISVPIFRRNKEFFGTLCAIDPHPANLKSSGVIETFRLFADLIAFHLEAREQLEHSQQALIKEKQISELREQFIAVLGHDLRNPLNSIHLGLALSRRLSPEQFLNVVPRIEKSAHRMGELIENVMDFAQGRLGGGITIERSRNDQLKSTLLQVVDELKIAHPNRRILVTFEWENRVACDAHRLGQLLSNLLANALIHGDKNSDIQVSISEHADTFKMTVSNQGAPIPPEIRKQLFQPFMHRFADENQPGLGLGLYIVSEIARAHNGRMDVASTLDSTDFTFSMPIAVA